SISASLNRPIDMITICFITWNVGVAGMFCIHWKGPLRVQQAYLIFMSALLALVFYKFLPDWTGWLILGVISIWDLFAVLCPRGPLRILVETAHERGEQIFPALIYSSTMVYMVTAVDPPSEPQFAPDNVNTNTAVNVDEILTEEQRNERAEVRNNNARRQLIPRSDVPQTEGRREPARYVVERSNSPVLDDDDDEKGVKLGLGDFIFYSILLAKASALGDWNVTVACYLSLLIGLCLTLLLLAIIRKALPALPISITFALILYFSTVYIIGPFSAELNLGQVFI
ncbi:unnamed protein product, partial [Rotaria sp. Silwood2]